MPNYRFGQPITGNVYSFGRNPYGRNATTRTRTHGTCVVPSTPSIPGSTSGSGISPRLGGYDISRYNPAYDRLEEGSVIEDWMPRDLAGLNKLFRIIYTRDSICGPAIDIMSTLPWSSFDLHGVEDKKLLQFYEEAAQLFGDRAQEMPAITIEYLALGRFCSSLIYDEEKGFWTDFVPHDSDFLTITPIPVRNFDPKIDLMLSPGIRQFVSSTDYRDLTALQKLPESLVQALRRGGPIPLDPLNTLYIRRKSSPYDFVGTSALTRIIPYWAVEKALMNAMVTAARRRAGNILHVTAGIDDRWEPSPEEMEDIAGLFIQADEDPVGAVVATRTGVDASEVRSGGDIWKWSDEWQWLSEAKMRGMGISEALLSGDATYSNMEQARSTFTEQILALRQYLTNQVYYRRFKTLARAHGFRKRKKAELDHRIRIQKDGHEDESPEIRTDDLSLQNLSQEEALDIPESDLIVPTMQWHKSLLPEGDRDYLDLLQMLKEEGVPIPLKVWAARGGYDLTEALDMLEEDVKLREKIKKWKKATGAGEEEEGGAFGETEADSSPLWDPADRFMHLRKSEAKKCLQALVDTVYQPGKHHVLADTRHVMRTCSELLGGHQQKIELMAYVLMRLGVCRGLPVSKETAAAVLEYLANKPNLSVKRRVQELNAANRILAQHVDEQDPVVDQCLAGVLQQAAGQDGLELEQPQLRVAT
jgi:hypothetical protein